MALNFWKFLCLLGSIHFVVGEPIVKLDVGTVRGLEMKSESGKDFYAFRGIPYAEPPVKKLRFRPPISKKSWGDDILDATKDGPVCPQIDFESNAFVGQEDNCLILNVYSNQIGESSSKDLKPVMVYFHGGGFQFGTGSSSFYGPQKLLDHDIVLVTLNYRLGALGFLSTGDSESPGNYGMLDQVEALKWVNNHISHFGGDVNQITIFGSSAGGASVTYHTLSPLSKGLFRRAIALSGSAMCPWAFQPEPLIWAQKSGIELGCVVHDTEKMMKCLRGVPAKNLTETSYSFNIGFLPIVLAPVVDKHFLPDEPRTLFEQGKVNNDISFMTGITKDESAFLYAWLQEKRGPQPITKVKQMKEAFKDMLGTTLFNFKAVDLLSQEYLDDLDIQDEEATRKIYMKVNDDGLFDVPHYYTAHLMAHAGVQTYAFNYDYEAPYSFTQLMGQKPLGVSHMDDAFMLFDGVIFNYAVFDERSEKMKMIFQALLVTFAAEGNPTPVTTNNIPVEWYPVQPDNLWIYHIDDPLSIVSYNPKSDPSYDFWLEKIPKALKESRVKQKANAKEEL